MRPCPRVRSARVRGYVLPRPHTAPELRVLRRVLDGLRRLPTTVA